MTLTNQPWLKIWVLYVKSSRILAESMIMEVMFWPFLVEFNQRFMNLKQFDDPLLLRIDNSIGIGSHSKWSSLWKHDHETVAYAG